MDTAAPSRYCGNCSGSPTRGIAPVSSSKILSSSIVVGRGHAILLAALAALLHTTAGVQRNNWGRVAVCEAPRAVAISNERGHEPVSTPTTTSAVTRPSPFCSLLLRAPGNSAHSAVPNAAILPTDETSRRCAMVRSRSNQQNLQTRTTTIKATRTPIIHL